MFLLTSLWSGQELFFSPLHSSLLGLAMTLIIKMEGHRSRYPTLPRTVFQGLFLPLSWGSHPHTCLRATLCPHLVFLGAGFGCGATCPTTQPSHTNVLTNKRNECFPARWEKTEGIPDSPLSSLCSLRHPIPDLVILMLEIS